VHCPCTGRVATGADAGRNELYHVHISRYCASNAESSMTYTVDSLSIPMNVYMFVSLEKETGDKYPPSNHRVSLSRSLLYCLDSYSISWDFILTRACTGIQRSIIRIIRYTATILSIARSAHYFFAVFLGTCHVFTFSSKHGSECASWRYPRHYQKFLRPQFLPQGPPGSTSPVSAVERLSHFCAEAEFSLAVWTYDTAMKSCE
jgi:hypothetical protein